MEMEEFRASRYADGLRRHRAFIVAITVCGILAGAFVSRSSTGQSMTVLLSIEQQSALALTGDNNQRASTPIFSVRDEVNALTQRLTKLNITAEATMDPDQSGAKVTISGMSKTTLENDVARAQNEWKRIHKDSVTLWANAVSASLRTRARALEDSLKAATTDTSRTQEAAVLAASIAELSGRTAALDEYAETAERRANFISGPIQNDGFGTLGGGLLGGLLFCGLGTLFALVRTWLDRSVRSVRQIKTTGFTGGCVVPHPAALKTDLVFSAFPSTATLGNVAILPVDGRSSGSATVAAISEQSSPKVSALGAFVTAPPNRSELASHDAILVLATYGKSKVSETLEACRFAGSCTTGPVGLVIDGTPKRDWRSAIS